MCGRFTLRTGAKALAEHFACEIADLPPRYNVAPTQMVASVWRGPDNLDNSGRRFVTLRWGLIPSWAEDLSIGSRMINARAESLAEKPAFRVAFRRRRCLVLSDGYFEWLTRGKIKDPFYFRLRDERPFAFAGLWEAWRNGEDRQVVYSCTVITTEANDLSRPIHDRMPAILAPPDYEAWLDPAMQEPARLQAMLRPYPPREMIVDPVSRHVNNARHDDAKCIQIVRELF